MPKISGHTQLLGVIGDPIAHTLSPAMHNAALEHLGLNYVYVPFGVKSQQLGVAIAGLDALNVVGFNVTIPHKETILPYLADVSDLAQQVGAVNTVYRSEKGWVGTNTDVHGFLAPLRQQSYPWSEIAVLVLGYGGAARAVVTACYDLGCRQIYISGRQGERLEAFVASWPQITLHPLPWSERATCLENVSLVVNTTPIGMSPHTSATPLTAEDLAKLPATAIVYDLIYKPRPTLLLQLAMARGLQTFDGLAMLLHQGAAALEYWIGQPAPTAIMATALETALGREK
ncbi:shikimate dehydrogenase [Thermosynechococcus sp. B0]|uniref:shikimate dehydrogenase n=1 Tax=unclassified Thermosynechococcus TaxID=2622553 RepID=UPI00122E1140|nr:MULTISPECIES: shikimate dehydrogenase [unclassified Thermosynechococcus]QEQ02193.1 shikimate dehydrogenase [Thermosynechococcus sp. CL-1]WJI24091.1 shikimate dehydrogenase [Thermosynechococcus sp. B0]WJI29131.1 shikimate dehydrogenase [Thermosynechococcus sp. B3]WKT83722.1 shikimate dehydrogenase [Thermosynechococcus sp. HY596]WNC62853.1 shikimate dehydrogenase [Thermosynechococcus sp. HY591]